MAYSIASNSVVQVTMKATLFNQRVMNVFHYRWEIGSTPITDGAAALADFDVALQTELFYEQYLDMLPPQVIDISTDLQWIYPLRYVKRNFVRGPVGTGPNNTTITNMATALLLRGDVATRRAVGTKHIPGLGGVDVVAGKVSAGQIAATENFANTAILPVTFMTGTMRPIVFGRARPAYTDKHGNLHPALPVSTIPITTFEVEDTARVMRRRTVGLGI